MPRFIPLSVFITTCLMVVTNAFAASPQSPGQKSSDDQIELFETRIRPVLVEHCYSCHNSADSREGELAVDDREGTLRGGEGGKIIIPGDPNASRLIAILKHEVEGLEMPEDGPKLDARVIADFERWIRNGAVDPRDHPPSKDELEEKTSWTHKRQRRKQWWSWQPIEDISPPSGDGDPIDRFIRVKLDEQDLAPAPPADPHTLIRRLYLTLIGLPPTDDELGKWLERFGDSEGKQRDAAIDQLIEDLLGSVHFGERWARHWMDWIRYAESHGSEGDPAIDNAWFYRDYLIRALNSDIPYDTLVREHIAGDLLREQRVNRSLGINESMIGPTHWRMVFHGFAPTDALDEKVRFIDDQIDVFSKAFLGLTVSCARCHDHKFDAISQKDYYALFGILSSCRPARQVIDLPEEQAKHVDALRQLKGKIRQAVFDNWLKAEPAIRERIRTIVGGQSEHTTPLAKTLRQLGLASQNEDMSVWSEWAKQRDGDRTTPNEDSHRRWTFDSTTGHDGWYQKELGLQSGPCQPGEFTVALSGNRVIGSVYPAGVYSHLLTPKHAARLTSPDFQVGEMQSVWVYAIGDSGSTFRYVIQDYPRNGTVYPVKPLKPEWQWQRLDLSYWRGDSAHIEFATGEDAPLLTKNESNSWFGIREVRITNKDAPRPAQYPMYRDALLDTTEQLPSSLQETENLAWNALSQSLFAWKSNTCTNAQADLIQQALQAGLLGNTLEELDRVRSLVTRYRELEQSIKTPTRVPGLDETTGRTQPLYVRGNHKQPGEKVPRRFLEAIDEKPYGSLQSGRAQLAEDVLRSDNPLSRRVIVNRVWHHLFGRGIVETPDNFGRLGQPPTHPELLDWLAVRFEHDGWSLKSLIRLIVRTKTWQQSSTPSTTASEVDPDNRFLSHASVRRLDAESIRDSLLASSGELDRTPFGPPVNGSSPRRSVYVAVIRNRLDPFLRVFDFPEPSRTTGRRDVTNVPAQSLTMMNDARLAKHASKLAQNVIRTESSDDARVTQLYLSLFCRPPSTQELEFAREFRRTSQVAVAESIKEVAAIRKQLEQMTAAREQILIPARETLLATKPLQDETGSLRPFASWSFDSDLTDRIGELHGTAHGAATLEDGFLRLQSGGYVTTPTLPQSIREKTLEAWVAVENLRQRGGGVLTVQTPNGAVFDSIVFGERDPQHWLAGSNNFARTEPFRGDAEVSSHDEFVHVAIVYQADGRIIGYRNGKPYGTSYKRGTPITFQAGEAIVSFGVRHLPAGGNRLFQGRIDRANLYDRALSPEEVAASFAENNAWVSNAELVNSLTDAQRAKLDELAMNAEMLNQELHTIGPIPDRYGVQEAWTDLARTLLTLKEFIYVR